MKLVHRSIKIFEEKSIKKYSELNALLNKSVQPTLRLNSQNSSLNELAGNSDLHIICLNLNFYAALFNNKLTANLEKMHQTYLQINIGGQ